MTASAVGPQDQSADRAKPFPVPTSSAGNEARANLAAGNNLIPPHAAQGDPARVLMADPDTGQIVAHETKAESDSSILSERDKELGAERARILKAARPLIEKGHPLEDIAFAVGTSLATLWRLNKTFGHLPDGELTAERLATRFGNSGRTSPWAYLALVPGIEKRLQYLYLLTIGSSSDEMGKDRRSGSAALALERFADDDLCPPALKPLLRAGKFPKPLLSLIRKITPEMEQTARGPKHQSLNANLTGRRELVEILADGSNRQIAAGDWWVFDDMSDNQPFWFLGPDGKKMVGRQGLYGYDITRRWLGVELVGTSRDSYTAAIILRFIRRLMQAKGKPRRGIVFEQSVWKANVIAGFRVTTAGELVEETFERPEMEGLERKLLQDGLRSLGIEIIYTHTPRGKEIEGAFNYLQRVLPTFSPEQINIGRHAGEFEKGAKALRRAHAGSHDVASLGFAEMDARADTLSRAMEWIDNRDFPSSGYPVLSPLSASDLPSFLPHKHELMIRGGRVTATVDGEPYDFTNPTLFAALGSGYRLYVKFDPAEPTLGAAIYNRETSSANWERWPIGQLIGMADFMLPAPRFDFRHREERQGEPGLQARKTYNKFVRTAFRAVGLPQFRAATARDGKGNVATVEGRAGSPQPAGARAVTPAPARPRMRVELTAAQLQQRRARSAEDAELARELLSD
jgi:hypothetical protein